MANPQTGVGHKRFFHSSWAQSDGIILMGGTTLTVTGAEAARNDTYIARFDGTTQFLYEMKYLTMYVLHLFLKKKIRAKRHIFRRACAIPDGDSVVITGGVMSETRKKASRYNRQGWVEDLPDMSIGRFHHGCAGYTKNGEQVST